MDRELVRRYAASADRAVPAHYRVLTLDDATWKLLQSATARVAAGQAGELSANEAETLAHADAKPDVRLACGAGRCSGRVPSCEA